jgi:hypothetical protein
MACLERVIHVERAAQGMDTLGRPSGNVIPAQAGIQCREKAWMPAYAGMTNPL